MSRAWTIEIDDSWIAWLTFDAPGRSVNTFDEDALDELAERLDELAANEAIKAIAIRSGKRSSFIAGADIEELASIDSAEEARAKSEVGHEIFAKIAALPVPVVAVIHGACLGGGLEMSLACHYRLATDDPRTSLGLPEVNLGILPGWGGTQRLPRVVGMASALRLILTGKPVDARRAARMGLVDGVIAHPFLEASTRKFIDGILTRGGRRKVERKRIRSPLSIRVLESTALGRRFMAWRAGRDVRRKTGSKYPAPLEALDVIRRTYGRTTLEEGIREEIDAFCRLACTSVSRNLVWIFQASQRMKKTDRGDEAITVCRAGVVGAGIMGSGIAWALSRAEISVRLRDISWEAVARGLAASSRMFQSLVKRRRMKPGAANRAMHRIGGTVDWTGFASTDVVIEAVVEEMSLKTKVLRDIEANVRSDTIICTNTSSLPLHELAGVLDHPKRFIGLHFFNPVNRMKLVEVIPHRKTSRQTVVTTVELVRRMGKLPVVVGDCPGFLVNRILLPYLMESAWMYEEGVDSERIDRALVSFGMPMGPLTLADEVGLEVGYKAAKVLESAYGERMQVASVLTGAVEDNGLCGRKSGAGIYVYRNGHRKPNRLVDELRADARERDGVGAVDLSDEEIVDRAVLIMVNEAARCLDEGVVSDPEQLDLAMVMGTGFAPFRGGLLRYADTLGAERVARRLEHLATTFGDRFEPAPMITRLAERGDALLRRPTHQELTRS